MKELLLIITFIILLLLNLDLKKGRAALYILIFFSLVLECFQINMNNQYGDILIVKYIAIIFLLTPTKEKFKRLELKYFLVLILPLIFIFFINDYQIIEQQKFKLIDLNREMTSLITFCMIFLGVVFKKVKSEH